MCLRDGNSQKLVLSVGLVVVYWILSLRGCSGIVGRCEWGVQGVGVVNVKSKYSIYEYPFLKYYPKK